MRTIFILIKKEFLQVFRSPLLLSILIVAPLAQFILFPFTADYEIKVLEIAFIDRDHSTTSRNIINDFAASNHFVSHGLIDSKVQADYMMKKDEIDFIVELPAGLEKSIMSQEQCNIAVTANAINSVKAGIGTSYVQSVLGNFMSNMAENSGTATTDLSQIITTNIYWYNEQMNYKNLIVPGILVILVTLIGAYVTALNLVREKEIGTMEQINVTPIKKWQFLLGKTIPFWILGMMEFMVGLVLMYFIFHISVQGSVILLLGVTAIYLCVMVALGFFISSISENQLQAMFIVFFLFIVFVLLSGLFTPTEGMPSWALHLNYLNPMSFFMDVIKQIILKGSTVHDIQKQIIILSVMAVVLNTAALIFYRDRVK